MNVVIVDYGMGNLRSVYRAFEECGADVRISESPQDLKTATHVVLPGVGAFPDGMTNLHDMNYVQALEQAAGEGIPLMGICLGMQLLADLGYEIRKCEGLGLIKGEVKKLEKSGDLRIPHVGWNELETVPGENLFKDIPQNSDFYFVHSYHFVPVASDAIIGTSLHGQRFVSAVRQKNIFGVQFHPEKSSKLGMTLLKNFLNAN